MVQAHVAAALHPYVPKTPACHPCVVCCFAADLPACTAPAAWPSLGGARGPAACAAAPPTAPAAAATAATAAAAAVAVVNVLVLW